MRSKRTRDFERLRHGPNKSVLGSKEQVFPASTFRSNIVDL